MEIVKVVVDQVIVALSHATVLEELMREKLEARNGLQQQAKENVVKASQTRYSFQNLMNNGMRRPMHSILGLLSILQDENTSTNQKIIIDTMVRMSTVLLNLINDAMDIPDKDEGRFPVKMMSF
ncbi:ethylene receptor 2-like [Solanum lycopersicum]|uniref:ethylene receptor 2-like n=1 Tax=Solanum lycopersicum TaxID=4081 RepID=UPI00374988E9